MESINALSAIVGLPVWAVALVVLWTLIWKGLALWRAAGLRQKWWFIALFFINTLGLLEIIYLFIISRKYRVEVIEEK